MEISEFISRFGTQQSCFPSEQCALLLQWCIKKFSTLPDVLLSRAMSCLLSCENARGYSDLQSSIFHTNGIPDTGGMSKWMCKGKGYLNLLLYVTFYWLFPMKPEQGVNHRTGPLESVLSSLYSAQGQYNMDICTLRDPLYKWRFCTSSIWWWNTFKIGVILSWITSTYRSAVGCGMKMKSGTVSRVIIE